MNAFSFRPLDIPPEQRAIRDKCFHPTGTFIEFEKSAIEQSIPNRFEQQVRRYPNRLAVKTGKEELTYNQLNKSANRVAHAILAERGEGQEPVALLLEHGLGEIVAALACLKAGKIFMQIDRSLPEDRITRMLEDSQTGIMVTDLNTFPRATRLAWNRCLLLNIDPLQPPLGVSV